MLASKENARKALRYFGHVRDTAVASGSLEAVEFIDRFIEATIKRLPSEASYKRDRERRRPKAKS